MIRPHPFTTSLEQVPGISARLESGEPLPLLRSAKGGFAAFGMDGPATVILSRPQGWEHAAVKPASAGADVVIDGPDLRIRLQQSRPLLIETRELLISLLAKPPSGEPPQPGPGGRLLRFRGGKVHEAGLLELGDNDVVWLDPGAWVRGHVFASGARDLVIGGNGVLENPPLEPGQRRQRAVLLDHCANPRISGIHMLTTHSWMVTLGGCEGALVDGISQEGCGSATDGIDIVGSRAVRIRGCFLLNGDDNIAVKAMHARTQAFPAHVATSRYNGDWTGPVSGVRVEGCALYNDHGGSAMEIGYETRTDLISDIVFRDIDVMAVHQFGSVFGIHNGDRASVESVLWEDIRVEHHYDKLVDLRVLHSRWNLDGQRGRVRNVTLRRIRAAQSLYNAGYTVSVIGGHDAGHRIEGVAFEDFQLGGRHILDADAMDLYVKQAGNITFK